jgi:hypothetical protein
MCTGRGCKQDKVLHRQGKNQESTTENQRKLKHTKLDDEKVPTTDITAAPTGYVVLVTKLYRDKVDVHRMM